MSKSFLHSKKFYFNALTVLVVIATFFGYTPDTELSDNLTGLLVVVAPFVNLVLTTFFTKKAIEPVLPSHVSSD
jgi:hypothetical protein